MDLGFDEIFTHSLNDSIVLAEPAMCAFDLGLGNFDSVWHYLSNTIKHDTLFRQSPTSLNDLEESKALTPKEKKQRRKRELRTRNRRQAHEQIEALAIPDSSDLPDLGDYTSASDPEASFSSSEDEASTDERLALLRVTLDSATKAFRASPSATSRLVKSSTKERTLSLHKKLSTAFPDEDALAVRSDIASYSPPRIAFVDKPWGRKPTYEPSTGRQTHLFVDSSNIYLGFQDLLRQRRANSQQGHLNYRPNMDIHILDTILERGRSCQVKALVGSAPLLQSWEDAKTRRYEVSILERVATSETSSKREQGVDELLHLKMMESLLDSASPGIMVLATGDANVAQFSSGFFNVVLRALSRGWHVEVWAFARSVNKLWLDRQFRNEYRAAFSLFYLDDYLEELEC